ncbi:MAG: hemerythrin family protein [Rhodospirillaceae bacterium]
MGLFDWFRKTAVAEPIYSVMNEDHIELYRILGELRLSGVRSADDAAVRERKRAATLDVMQRLIEESRAHFRREEALMARYDYPAARAHKDDHLVLLMSIEVYFAQVAAGSVPATDEVSDYLKTWLTSHIRNADHLLERFLCSALKRRRRYPALIPAVLRLRLRGRR